MVILKPDYILTPSLLLTDKAIAFDRKIQAIDSFDILRRRFPQAETIELQKNSLVMPGLINAHVHLEFSANRNQLSYGDFVKWLYSVIENREELVGGCDLDCMHAAIDSMLANGITTFGAISSHGADLKPCTDAKQNVVFFSELIGSQANMADALFADFLARLDGAKAIQREGFFPAVAIHAPYSVHPILIRKALEIVKNEQLRLTAHFMESEAERNWLDTSSGAFCEFFQKFLQQKRSVSDAKEFLDHFNGYATLLTHAVQANSRELAHIAQQNHTIVHCPVSNRLLGNATLNIERLQKRGICWIVATDGLSSNYKLDLFEEIKISLFMHSDAPLLEFAKQLLEGVTVRAAKALGLNTGEVKEGKNADLIVLDLDTMPNEELAIHLIVHRYNISKVFINGELVKGEG